MGADAEWRCDEVQSHRARKDKVGIALLQLSSSQDVCLVDLVTLKDNQVLDKALTRLFNNAKTVIVGFSFSSDMSRFSENLPNMNFYKKIANLLDV